MLDPWIIDEILRREEEKRREQERARIEAPLETPRGRDSDSKVPAQPPPETERGVLIIDI
jgi:hypothetical protein